MLLVEQYCFCFLFKCYNSITLQKDDLGITKAPKVFGMQKKSKHQKAKSKKLRQKIL